MATLSAVLLAQRESDDTIAALCADFDVVVTDLGSRVEADTRSSAIRGRLESQDSEWLHLRSVFDPDGRRCTYSTIDLDQQDLYDEFDLIFRVRGMDLEALYDALAELLSAWRSRGRPRRHWIVQPYEPIEEDDDVQ
jgi:hypothetical protein